jgi:hypothetical protein
VELLTASRLKTYRECSRLHKLRYIDGWRPVVESDALRFGTMMHKGLAKFWEGCSLNEILAQTEGEADEFERAKAAELLVGYYTRYTGHGYEVLAVEPRFEMPLINPDTMLPSRTYMLAGGLDGILRKAARTAVLEHKTTSTDLDDVDYWDRLQMDQQISVYVLGGESLGHQIDDTLYDVIRKPGIRPYKATPAENRKFKANGELYANQRDRDETPEEFAERLRADIAADPDKYFKMRSVPRMNSQIEDSMADMWQTAQMLRARHYPRNPDACFKWGSRCPFWDCCVSGMNPEEHPELFRKVKNVHEELA